MRIEIIKNISDPDLIIHWKRIQEETDCFPQMYYEWCEPWWRLQHRKLELYIIVVKDENNKIIGIAPLCIQNRFGLRILLSFPIHFGDFYSFLIEGGKNEDYIRDFLIQQLLTFQNWHYVKLDQINNKTLLYSKTLEAGFSSKKLTGIVISNFANMTFDGFLKSLPKKVRNEYRRRMRRIKELGTVKFEIYNTSEDYKAYSDIMKDMYAGRWINDHSTPPDSTYYQCRMESFGALCDIGKAILCVLNLDGTTIAFRLGFLNRNQCYSWKVCFDPQYYKYSPGSLITGCLIEKLIEKNYTQLNYGCGVYQYKLSWAPDGENSENYSMQVAKGTIRPSVYLKYQLEWRDKVRVYYHKLLAIGWVMVVKRWAEAQYRKLKQ